MAKKQEIKVLRMMASHDGQLVVTKEKAEMTKTAQGVVIHVSDKIKKLIPWSNIMSLQYEEA